MNTNQIYPNVLARVCAVIVSAIILVSCGVTNQTSTTISNPPVESVTTQVQAGDRYTIWGGAPTLPEGLTQAEYREMLKYYDGSSQERKLIEKRHYIFMSKSWQEARTLIEQYIAETKGDKLAFMHHHDAGIYMLGSWFMYIDNPTREEQEAMAYYLEILRSLKSFRDLSLMIQILPKMQGFWNESKIAEFAQLCLTDYNTRRYALAYGKSLSATQYFTEQAKKQLVTTASGVQPNNSTSSASSQTLDVETVRKVAQTIRTSFSASIPAILKKNRTGTPDGFAFEARQWLNPPIECAVILSILAEGGKL
jgi:hypothetical protein